jgi:nitrous oxide reductase accessory protein NosL
LNEKVPFVLMKKSVNYIVIVLLFLFGCVFPASVQAVESLQPGGKDRCAVCGMMVEPYPNWVAAVTFKDGSHNFFDGPKDLFNFVLNLSEYRPGATIADIKEVQVTEYYTAQRHDAREVFFVAGSDVLGPMGQELVPVAGAAALKTFMLDHGYEKIMRFDGEDLSAVDPLP